MYLTIETIDTMKGLDTSKLKLVACRKPCVSILLCWLCTDLHHLTLQFIHGFDTHQNSIAWHPADKGIVFDPFTKKQSFYLELSDNIIYLAFCSSSSLSGVVATGQIGKRAMVHVWDHPTKEALFIVHCAVDFGSSGKSLLSVGVDQRHSIMV